MLAKIAISSIVLGVWAYKTDANNLSHSNAKEIDDYMFELNDIFHALTFDKVGEYVFRMSEVMGELDNMDYDKTVNHFTVLVTDVDMDGTLEINTVSGTENAVVSIADGGFDVRSCVFSY